MKRGDIKEPTEGYCAGDGRTAPEWLLSKRPCPVKILANLPRSRRARRLRCGNLHPLAASVFVFLSDFQERSRSFTGGAWMCRRTSESLSHQIRLIISHLTCDSSYLPFENRPHEAGDVRPQTHADEMKGLQCASVDLLEIKRHIYSHLISLFRL